MATNLSRSSAQKSLNVKDAKVRVLELIAEGFTVIEAMSAVDRKEATYLDWRKTDQEFRASVDGIRNTKKELAETGRPPVPDFPEFCREWLKEPLFDHQLRGWEAIQGEMPHDLHESMTYLKGNLDRVLLNFPPDHAKSTTFTVNLVVWLIHKNPSVNVVVMSQSSKMAERFLGEIKFKLTSPVYRDMHLRFAPNGEWKDKDRSWTNDSIFVKGKDGRKDPTVQALGLSGQIYGTRADLVILDDIITTKNNREIPKQMVLIQREVQSRLPARNSTEKRLPDEFPVPGMLLVLGTRVAPIDLYRELIDLENFYGQRVWTYLRQPAVMDYGEGTPESWTTLWPERWDGPSLAMMREGEAMWALIYQQLNVTEDMTFLAEAVEASVDGSRFTGPMTPAGVHHREKGMEGLYVIAGLDPATVGATAMIVIGYDPETQKRWILDGFNKTDCPPHVMREKIQYFTEVYGVQTWVIERNAYQRAITQDRDLINYLRSKGCHLKEHTTGTNKFDSDFGIATMGPLFMTCGQPDPKNPSGRWIRTPDSALISLPSKMQNDWCADLVQELVVWQPEGMAQKQKTDLVMALWFCEIEVKHLINRGKKKQYYRDTPFTSVGQLKKRKVISLVDIKRARQEAEIAEGTG